MPFRFSLILLILSLQACSLIGKRGSEHVPVSYDFGPQPVVEQVAAAGLRSLEVRMPAWLDTQGIDYRLAYADAAQLHEYTLSRWVGPPSQLIQQRLAQHLHTMPPGAGRGVCLLRVELSEFAQVFDSAQSSRGVVRGHAWWLDRDRKPVAERAFEIVKIASSQDARGGAQALAISVDTLGEQLLNWEKSVSAQLAKAGCAN